MSERFWNKVRKSDGCWEWTASQDMHGYGQYWYPAVPGHPSKQALAHASAADSLRVYGVQPRCIEP